MWKIKKKRDKKTFLGLQVLEAGKKLLLSGVGSNRKKMRFLGFFEETKANLARTGDVQ